MKTIRVIIKGKVQGVFFRATAREMADNLGVKGWVKNAWGGDVEITATGMEDKLKQFIEWCKQGPPRAEVTDVIVEELPFENFSGFRVIR